MTSFCYSVDEMFRNLIPVSCGLVICLVISLKISEPVEIK